MIRSNVPRLELDQAFESKDDVARAVKEQLSALMQEYGYEILGMSEVFFIILICAAALVIDLNPDIKVKTAMNEINGLHHSNIRHSNMY